MGFGTRQPTSNDLPKPEKKGNWSGENELMDKFALRLNKQQKDCAVCGSDTHVRYLDSNGLCPDCQPCPAA